MRAGMQCPITPSAAAVEFGDQTQPAVIGGVEMTGKLGDLLLELVKGQAMNGGLAVRGRRVHLQLQ